MINNQRGVIALSITTIVLFIGVTIVLSLVFVFMNGIEIARNVKLSEQAYFAAESGIEDILLRRLDSSKSMPTVNPYTLNVLGALVSIDFQDMGNTDEITVTADNSNRIREIFLTLSNNTTGESFVYGAQVGGGGLEMDNDAQIIGSIYSNGSIIGSNGATITGDAIVAGNGNELENINVGGNAFAYEMDNCDITGNATYVTGGGGVGDCDVGGTTTEQSQEIPTLSMPIPQSTIDEWKQDAADDGEIISVGDYNPSSDVPIGPGVIEGDLNIDGNVQITLMGTVWVKGNIDVKNGGSIILHSSYGDDSGVIITDGWIHIRNNGVFAGSGEQSSYLMILSMSACRGIPIGNCTHHDAAMDIHNNAKGAIFYAPNGLINLHNDVEVIQLTAWKIKLQQGAKLEYAIGLSDLEFSSGPLGGRSINGWYEQ